MVKRYGGAKELANNMNYSDPFDLYETVYWAYVAGQQNHGSSRTASTKRENDVNDAIMHIYKKLENKKVTINIGYDDKYMEGLRNALSESVKLQSHYAELLNNYDGGERMTFKNIDEWLTNLAHKQK